MNPTLDVVAARLGGSEQVRRALGEVWDLARAPFPVRLARYLIDAGPEIDRTSSEIADDVGASRAAATNLLLDMQRNGVLARVGRGPFRVLDRASLARLAGVVLGVPVRPVVRRPKRAKVMRITRTK